MAQSYVNYASASDISLTLVSLASDTNLLAGQASAAIDNTVNKYRDYWISGKVTTGTSPTASRQIELWLVGSWDGTTYPDSFGGTNAAVTVSSSANKASVCRFLANMATSATSNVTYHFGPVLVSSVFGGDVPPKFQVFCAHNTGVALNSTSSNHQIRLQPVFDTVT